MPKKESSSTIAKENKGETKVIEKEAEAVKIKVPKKEAQTNKENPEFDSLDDLPESIKKKLEETKNSKKKKKRKIRKKKERKNITIGKAFVKATYNNTIVTITDLGGNTIAWSSAGVAGFKGPKKSTSYAGQIITRIAVQKARETGLEEVNVYVKGVGTGREAAIRTLNSAGLTIRSIYDITPIPHNGCRARKPRRI